MKKLIFDEELVITQYYAFRSCYEVAKMYECNPETIRRVLMRRGVSLSGWKAKKREPTRKNIPIDEAERQRIIDEYKRRGSVQEAARVTHHAQEIVSKMLYDEGIFKNEKRCENCGKLFKPRLPSHKWCSRTCRNAGNPGDDRKRCRRYGVYFDPKIRREDVFERDKYICQICGVKCDPNDFGWGSSGATHPTIDHIIPLSKGGTHTWDNVQCACALCNSVKRDIV